MMLRQRVGFTANAQRLVLTLTFLLIGCFGARAAECDSSGSDPSSAAVGLYAEWPTDALLRQYENVFLTQLRNLLDSGADVSVCTITKAVFPSLGTSNLSDINSIRRMLNDPTELTKGQTFKQKLDSFRLKYLVFLKVEQGGSPSTFLVVRLDDSGSYPKRGFEDGWASIELRDSATVKDLLSKVAAGIAKVREGSPPPQYPVFIMCFSDKLGVQAGPAWEMDRLVAHIPRELVKLLREKSYFQDMYPIEFEGTCPYRGVDPQSMNSQYGPRFGQDRWFVWTGTIYPSGLLRVGIQIDFLHRFNQLKLDDDIKWVVDAASSPWNFHITAAPSLIKKFETYLVDVVAKRRPDFPVPPVILIPPNPRQPR